MFHCSYISVFDYRCYSRSCLQLITFFYCCFLIPFFFSLLVYKLQFLFVETHDYLESEFYHDYLKCNFNLNNQTYFFGQFFFFQSFVVFTTSSNNLLAPPFCMSVLFEIISFFLMSGPRKFLYCQCFSGKFSQIYLSKSFFILSSFMKDSFAGYNSSLTGIFSKHSEDYIPLNFGFSCCY